MRVSDNTSLRYAEASPYQRSVDSFFRGRTACWRDIYQEDSNGFLPFYYRVRRAEALAMADRLGLPERSRVLELGCGAGLTAVALAKRGHAVDAVDTVEDMLDLTRKAALEAGVDDLVKTTLGNANEMNFPPHRFDLVVALGLMPWLERPAKALQETNRVLKLDGHVILTSSNRWCLIHLVDPLRFPGLRTLRWKIEDTLTRFNLRSLSQPRYHHYSTKQMDQMLSEAGFQKVEGRTIGFGPFTFLSDQLIPDHFGIKLHRRLQALADRQFPGIRSAGIEYAVTAIKATERRSGRLVAHR